MTVGEKHNVAIKLLARLDAALAPYDCHMQTQGPVQLGEFQEPEPDGAILKKQPRDYLQRLPQADDTWTVIEVSDSSLEFDRTTKLAKYAHAGISQYLIVNLVDGEFEVYEQPDQSAAAYRQKQIIAHDGVVSLIVGAAKRLDVQAADLLP